MGEQISLFDLDAPEAHAACLHPDVSGATGFDYGCRCQRCRSAHRQQAAMVADKRCAVDGCDRRRIKNNKHRLCDLHNAERLKRCAWPDCQQPRRQAQAAKYCEDHRTGRQVKEQPFECVLCGSTFLYLAKVERMRQYICCRACSKEHRHLLRNCRNHRVPVHMLREYLLEPKCALCPQDMRGRTPHIDHNHAHCDKPVGCAICVRGFLCMKCNHALGVIENLERRNVNIGAMEEYLQRGRAA